RDSPGRTLQGRGLINRPRYSFLKKVGPLVFGLTGLGKGSGGFAEFPCYVHRLRVASGRPAQSPKRHKSYETTPPATAGWRLRVGHATDPGIRCARREFP